MNITKIQPPFLKKGDKVAIISPSFFIEEERLRRGIEFLEDWGLEVIAGESVLKQSGPFAGSHNERLSDFQRATDDPEIKAVFCSRGGYGMSKIINLIDFSAVAKYPKWFIGFSDITVLHLWLSNLCGLISVHGEMPLNYNNPVKTPATMDSLYNVLFGRPVEISWEGLFLRQKNVKGEVTGGNLSLINSLQATPAEITTDNRILFIEDVGEYYYHIDRMLTSLKLSGKLEKLAALVVGGMNKLTEGKGGWESTIEETIFDIVKEYNYPVLFNFPAGHIDDNRAFYIGKEAKIVISGNVATLRFP